MAEKIVLKADKRELTGKKAKVLRKQGIVPGVIYGAKIDAINIQVEPVALSRVIAKAGRHAPVEIDLDGKKHIAILKDVSRVPARNDIFNFSFHAVSATEKVTTMVPVELINIDESPAKKAGLLVTINVEELEIRAKAADLPKSLQADASKLETVEDRLTIADLTIPKGVELTEEDAEQTIATVLDPAEIEAKNAAADEAANETPETEVENGAEAPAEA